MAPDPGPSSRRVQAGAVAVSAALLFLAFLPLPLPLPWVVLFALVPFWWALEGAGSVTRGAEMGAWFGVIFWAAHLHWMAGIGLRIGAAWPWMAWVGQVGLLGLLGAGTGAGYVLLRARGIAPVPAAVVAWVGVEWTRGHLLGPLDFPWSGIALPLARIPVLIQPAAWGGESLVAGAVVGVNATLALSASRRVGGRPGFRALALALLALTVWVGVGVARATLLEGRSEPRARVVVVQPAVPLAEKRGPGAGEAAVRSLRWGLDRAGERLGDDGEGVVVFPETHLPFVADWTEGPAASEAGAEGAGLGRGGSPWPSGLSAELAEWSRAHRVDVLVGAYRRDGRGVRNALLQVGPGGLVAAYDKVALVPGVEWGPGGLVPGRKPVPLEVPGRPGALICIESAWSSLALRQVRSGAGWLLNVTNDAWLGEGEGASAAFEQHPWHLVLRSVETGRGAVRVANNGWSGTVDPLGRWSPALAPHRPGVAVVSVRSLPGDPPFVRIGDLLGPFCVLGLLFGSLRRSSTPPVDPVHRLR